MSPLINSRSKSLSALIVKNKRIDCEDNMKIKGSLTNA